MEVRGSKALQKQKPLKPSKRPANLFPCLQPTGGLEACSWSSQDGSEGAPKTNALRNLLYSSLYRQAQLSHSDMDTWNRWKGSALPVEHGRRGACTWTSVPLNRVGMCVCAVLGSPTWGGGAA
jgi:hypothetical protein